MRRKAVFKIKACAMCGKEYTPSNAMQKYCPDCKTIAEEKRKKEWYFAHSPNAGVRSEKHYCVACGSPANAKFDGQYYCNKHWLRLYTNGTLELKGKKVKTKYTIDGDYAYGETSNGSVFKFDSSMFDKVSKHSWCPDVHGYFVATINKKRVILHRFLLDLEDKQKQVDHINGDKSDNTLANLRICTPSQNGKNIKKKTSNTSGQAGVSLRKSGKWRARIVVDRKEINLGMFNTFEQAKKARIRAEKKYYKEFSPTISRTVDP